MDDFVLENKKLCFLIWVQVLEMNSFDIVYTGIVYSKERLRFQLESAIDVASGDYQLRRWKQQLLEKKCEQYFLTLKNSLVEPASSVP